MGTHSMVLVQGRQGPQAPIKMPTSAPSTRPFPSRLLFSFPLGSEIFEANRRSSLRSACSRGLVGARVVAVQIGFFLPCWVGHIHGGEDSKGSSANIVSRVGSISSFWREDRHELARISVSSMTSSRQGMHFGSDRRMRRPISPAFSPCSRPTRQEGGRCRHHWSSHRRRGRRGNCPMPRATAPGRRRRRCHHH
jgi:hypothetical protein